MTTCVPVPLVLPPVWLQPLPPELPVLPPPPHAVSIRALPATTTAIFHTITIASLRNGLGPG